MHAPFRRLRPLRETAADRDLNAECSLDGADYLLPFFVVEGHGVELPLPTLEGVSHLSIDRLIERAREALDAGVGQVLLFGVPEPSLKAPDAREATRPDALVGRAVAALKRALPSLVVYTDVCLCAYTDHGHCGVLHGQRIDNDATLPLLAAMALGHARAGADFVAPSAMMDGQVAALRHALDADGLPTKILGYSAKYASRLYGPFRDAAGSAPTFGDRRSYQMDARNRLQGVAEAEADREEGADALMVKPATLYLDVLAAVKARFPDVPLAAYHTSGETMMLRHGVRAGLFAWKDILGETLTSLRRAGADLLITYNAVEAARWWK